MSAQRILSPGTPASSSRRRMSSPQRMCRNSTGSGNSDSLYFRVMRLRVATVVSGRGSNLAALLGALGSGAPAEVVLVLSDRADAGGLAVAEQHGVPALRLNDSADPAEWLGLLERHRVDLIVLAGYLRQVPAPVVTAYRGRMINIHPALLPRYDS